MMDCSHVFETSVTFNCSARGQLATIIYECVDVCECVDMCECVLFMCACVISMYFVRGSYLS